jgi:hypothetical protein
VTLLLLEEIAFALPPLSRAVTAFMHRSLERNQLRRNVYRAGHLRVCIDGEERLVFDPKVRAIQSSYQYLVY